VFKDWEGMEKFDVKGYVVPKFRCRVTERPFSRLSRKPAAAAENTG